MLEPYSTGVEEEWLEALVKDQRQNQQVFHKCSLMCLTEIWLTNNIPVCWVDLSGFTTVKGGRDLGGMS